MKTVIRERSGSKWRRSLMALAVLSAPVVSVAGFSGTASAALPGTDDVTFSFACTPGLNTGVITVVITSTASGSPKFDINFPGTADDQNNKNKGTYTSSALGVGPHTVSVQRNNDSSTLESQTFTALETDCGPEDAFSAVPACESDVPGITVTVIDVKPGNGPRNDIYVNGVEVVSAVADGTAVFIPLTAGTYDISVDVSGTSVGATQEVTVSAYVCVGEPEDGVVTEVCSGEASPGLNINIPNVKSGNGPKYTLYISPNGEDVDTDTDEADSNFGDGYDATYSTGEGVFHIIIVGPSDDELYREYFTVDCTNGGGGSGGWTINIGPLKPTTLPTTGSNTDTLLMIAPLMALLGGALIMARRRLATV